MPLFYQHNIHGKARLAVWHITEDEAFFLKRVTLQNSITHWHKRLQHLAGRYLLKELYADFPCELIEIANTKKPFLPGEKYHFSISHCGNYAAAIISESLRTGIDVELITSKIEKIKNKFLSPAELSVIDHESLADLTLLWSCKEAVYKWYGHGGLDFKKDMVVKNRLAQQNRTGQIECIFTKDIERLLLLDYNFFENLCLVWVAG